ncbi:hypothetical protein CAPTEDRAFT_201653 [Capitella teleta]|uniref:Uncharacterized protein n=1 Tax=Capitella teleta TaxID=283909 RepID=R7UWN6_CAPTE|nr:hypothetical protein CAPTEDRAFT_201653 [Capitella teleta]|eukprot:ELU10719.1 hypothetical protein CAPTEDRAFT_201653 [Capitella teleta]
MKRVVQPWRKNNESGHVGKSLSSYGGDVSQSRLESEFSYFVDGQNQSLDCRDRHDLAENSQDRIKDIQEECLRKLDITSKLLLEKHQTEMMKKVEEHTEQEKLWTAEKDKLQTEIERLQFCLVSKDAAVADYEKSRGLVETLQLKLNSLQQKNEKLLEDKAKMDKILSDHDILIQELDFLKDKTRNMEQEVLGAEQVNVELKLRNNKLTKEIEEIRAASHETVIDSLRRQIKKIMAEKVQHETAAKENKQDAENLKKENEKLRKALNDSESMRRDLQSQVTELKEQIAAYQKQSSERNFGEYVQLKRQYAVLKAENEELKAKLKLRYSVGTVQREPVITAVTRNALSRRSSETFTNHR